MGLRSLALRPGADCAGDAAQSAAVAPTVVATKSLRVCIDMRCSSPIAGQRDAGIHRVWPVGVYGAIAAWYCLAPVRECGIADWTPWRCRMACTTCCSPSHCAAS